MLPLSRAERQTDRRQWQQQPQKKRAGTPPASLTFISAAVDVVVVDSVVCLPPSLPACLDCLSVCLYLVRRQRQKKRTKKKKKKTDTQK